MLTSNEVFLLQLNKLGSEILKGRDLNKSLKKVLDSARKFLDFERVYLFTLNNKKDLLEVLMAVGKHSFIASMLKWPKNSMGGPTYVLKTGKSLLQHGLADKRVSAYYPQQAEKKDVLLGTYKLGKFGAGDIALVPVRSHGHIVAVLGADRLKQKLLPADLIRLEDFASQIGWAIENALLGQNMEQLIEKRTRELQDIQSQLIHSERLAAIGEMVAGITHEIKNPLTGIIGFTELLKSHLQDNEDSLQIWEGLDTSVKQLQNVVRNFLTFSKREAHTERQKVNINQALSDALSLAGYNLRKRNIRVDTRLAADLPLVMADKSQLVQVFTNIIMNAEQAMDEGGLLKINTQLKQNKIKIDIADSGAGIEPENLRNIFQSFFTTKGGNGTGLGLSVSQNIIKAHNGKISVRSTVGKGTTFTIFLPA